MLLRQDDTTNVLGFVSRFYTTLGEQRVEVDLPALEAALEHARRHLNEQPGGVEAASPFKKAASFVCHFIEAQPIKTPLPCNSNLRTGLTSATGSEPDQNTVVALRIAMESLHRATLRRSDGRTFELSRRLDLSKHSYADIVNALTGSIPAHFKYVTVLLEQLAYKTNLGCQYPSYQVSNHTSPECLLEPAISHDDLLDVWAGRARLRVETTSSPAVNPDDVTKGVELARASGELHQAHGNAPFHYRISGKDASLVDRVAADGSFVSGKILDGLFVEVAASDAS